MKVELRLPFPPRLSTYYGHNRFGREWISPEGIIFRKAVKAAIVDFREKNKDILLPMNGACSIWVTLAFKDLRDRDVDNYSKSLLDALKVNDKTNIGVVTDDSQFWSILMFKDYMPEVEESFCDVFIEEMSEENRDMCRATKFYAAKAKLAAKRASSNKRSKKALK